MAYVYVASDADGFLVAFDSQERLVEFISAHRDLDLVVVKYPINPEVDVSRVYVIPYYDNNAVAFVSNDLAEVLDFQRAFAQIGLVHSDDPKYWMTTVNEINASSAERISGPVLDPDKDYEESLRVFLDRIGAPERGLLERIRLETELADPVESAPAETFCILEYIKPVRFPLETIERTVPRSVQESIPELVSESVTEIVSDSVPEIVSESVTEIVSDSIPEIVSESVPEIVSETVPELVSDSIPELVSESVPEIRKG